MTSDEFRDLMRQLATEAAMSDATSLVEHGRVMIGERSAWLEHEPTYDDKLVQVRILLGTLEQGQAGGAARALLEANYVNGYGGDCVFSLLPESEQAVVTLKVRLKPAMSAREFWQDLSDAAHHGGKLWDEAVARTAPSRGLMSFGLHPLQAHHG